MPKRARPQTNRRDPNAVAFAIVTAATAEQKAVEEKRQPKPIRVDRPRSPRSRRP